MKILRKLLIIGCIIGLNHTCYATIFDIESMRVGPNPLIRGTDPFIINYVASKAHRSEYYIYKVSGELVFKRTYDNNVAGITQAGECQFTLLNASEISQVDKELYIVIITMTSETDTIKKRSYVVVK